MKVNGRLTITEGADIQNLTAPSGPEFPAEPNDAELFFKTQPTKSLFVYRDSGWVDLLGGGSGDAVEFISATANMNFAMPDASLFGSLVYRIKRIDSMSFSVNLATQNGQLIEGKSTFALYPHESLTMIGREGHWYII